MSKNFKTNPKVLLVIDFDHTICSIDSTTTYFVDEKKLITMKDIEGRYGKLDTPKMMAKERRSKSNLNVDLVKEYELDVKSLYEYGKYLYENHIIPEWKSIILDLKKKVDVMIASGTYNYFLAYTAERFNVRAESVALNYVDGRSIGCIDNGYNISKPEGLRRNVALDEYEDVVMVGDGSNDLKVFREGVANYMCPYFQWRQSKAFDVKEFKDSILRKPSELVDFLKKNKLVDE